MKDTKGEKQVSLAGMAGVGNTRQEQKGHSAGQNKHTAPGKIRSYSWIIWLVLLAILVTAVILLVQAFKGKSGPTLSSEELIEYQTTPENVSGKVAYFALGIIGEEPDSPLDMLAILSYDRRQKSAAVLQIPTTAYVGEGYGAATIGEVWAKPRTVDFCPSCRKKLTAEEISDGAHTACGSKIEKHAGSPVTDLMTVINTQYGLPVDNYILIPRKGLESLINDMGGIDLTVNTKFTVGENTYEPGNRTMTGAAAVYYVTQHEYSGKPGEEKARMLRQRQLLAALRERFARCGMAELYNDNRPLDGIISKLMISQYPVRFDTGALGKSRMLGSSVGSADNTKYARVLAEFALSMSKTAPEKTTCLLLPGMAANAGKQSVYSANRDQTVKLISEKLNPAGLTVTAETVGVPQVNDKQADADVAEATLDTVAIPQSEPVVVTPTETSEETENQTEDTQ